MADKYKIISEQLLDNGIILNNNKTISGAEHLQHVDPGVAENEGVLLLLGAACVQRADEDDPAGAADLQEPNSTADGSIDPAVPDPGGVRPPVFK